MVAELPATAEGFQGARAKPAERLVFAFFRYGQGMYGDMNMTPISLLLSASIADISVTLLGVGAGMRRG